MEKQELTNPFTAALEIKVIKLQSKKEFFDSSEYEQKDGATYPKDNTVNNHEYKFQYIVEQQQCAKLYRGELTDTNLRKLSDRASRMLIYILQKLPKDSEVVTIDVKEYKEEFGLLSGQAVYNAITDLIKASIITRQKPNRYWINPAIIFNGNRITKYPQKVDVVHIIPMKEPKK